MQKSTHVIYNYKEYTNPIKGDFVPNITAYIHENEEIRPAFIVVPGGGYRGEAINEGEFVAKEFYGKGYNTFVLSYTVAVYEKVKLQLQPLTDLSRAVTFVRKNAKQFKIDINKVSVCGFSAGGHLCGSLAVHYDETKICPQDEYCGISNKPNAVILSYPVITSGKYAHEDSIRMLIGDNATEEERDYMSLEKHVTSDTPPVFLWHTSTDELVPVENSYLFARACQEKKVPYELHIYGKGNHGYSLANEQWAANDIDIEGDYVMEQWFACIQHYINNAMVLPEELGGIKLPQDTDYRQIWRNNEKNTVYDRQPNPEVAMWPNLADKWLKDIYNQTKCR